MTDTSTKAIEALKDRVATLTAHGETWVAAEDYIALLAEREALQEEANRLRSALKPFSYIGIGSDPDYRPEVRIDREFVIAARAALDATAAKGEGA